MTLHWDTMTDREKDAAVAEWVCEWTDFWRGSDEYRTYIMAYPPSELSMGIEAERAPVPSYTTDRNAFAEVEAALERRGLQEAYAEAVLDQLDENAVIYYSAIEVDRYGKKLDEGWKVAYGLLTASLDIRCKAALRAVEAEVV